MSYSPEENETAGKQYIEGWGAVYELVRQGKSWSGRERHVGFLNTADGRFAQVSAVAGLDLIDDGRGLAVTDWDQDGKLDFWVTDRTEVRLRFLHNRTPGRQRFAAFRLEGTKSNRDAIGARVEVRLGSGSKRVRSLSAGDGYLAQSSKWLHFGLGEEEAIEEVTVRWPDGLTESFGPVVADGRYRLTEGSGSSLEIPAIERVSMPELRVTTRTDAGSASRTLLAGRVPLAMPEAIGEDGETIELATAGPMLLNLWASWCPNCRKELQEFAVAADRFEAVGLRVWALSTDEPSSRERAVEFLDGLDWPFDRGWATAELLGLLDLIEQVVHTRHASMVLPTSFLIDRAGRVAAIYRGPVEVPTLLSDVELLDASAEEVARAAVPFGGRWMLGPSGPPTLDLAALLGSHGDSGRAWFYLRDFQLGERAPPAVRERLAGILDRVAGGLERSGAAGHASEARSRAVATVPTGSRYQAIAGEQIDAGRLEEGIASLRKAVELAPDDTSIRLDLALTLGRHGDASAAEPLLRSVVESSDFGTAPHCTALYNLAVVSGEGGELAGGIERAAEALRCDASSFDAWMYLGVLHHRRGEIDRAIEAYRRADTLDPTNGRLIFFLGRALVVTGDLEGAQQQLGRLENMGVRAALNLRRQIESKRSESAGGER